jgi:hypothetical protein
VLVHLDRKKYSTIFFKRLNRLDLEIHEVDHQERFVVDMDGT